jgi:hypothetical protein
MIQIRFFQEEDVKENPNLVANGRFHYSVALERFHYSMVFERFHCLVALGRFHFLMANGRRRRNIFSPFLTFPPTNFT